MIRHEIRLPPEYVYPTDDWKFTEKRFYPRLLAQTETLFSLANGYLGMRGNFEEGAPAFQNATFVNGYYESWPIVYGEEAYGFPKMGQTMMNVTDGKIIRLYVDDEPFYLPTAQLHHFERVLNMKEGTLMREVIWETPAGKRVSIKSLRLVSFQHRHLAALSYQVTVLNAKAPVIISSEVLGNQSNQASQGDPRQAKGFIGRVLIPGIHYMKDRRIVMSHVTSNSKMAITCSADHVLETECRFSIQGKCSEDNGQVLFSVDAEPGKPINLIKYITYHTSRSNIPEELCARAERTLDRAVSHGFQDLLANQREYLDDFWRRSDVELRAAHPKAQQWIHWNLFQLAQASARAEGVGIPAKGLTGQAYDGHYFWDSEIYVLPFLIYTAPRIAKNLLKFRHSMLDKARERAEEMSLRGALFPWRTINGREASAFYPTGTAQYHINADIIYSLRKYVEATGNEGFLHEEGAEMLVETARMWRDLGFFSRRKGGKFCINEVTGPDEYNTVVHNNTFTNLMARENMRYAAATVESIKAKDPERLAALIDKTGLELSEVEEWKSAVKNMYIPFEARLGIHPQDDGFLDKETWDFKKAPPDKYPLLLNYHPLVIYRFQVIKQADIVLAMFLLGKEFSLEQKKRNFDYYDPLTTGDSSLSASIQSILAYEVGYPEKALQYFQYAVLMDLADVSGNVRDGVHVASAAGTWLGLVYGIAGMRDYDGCLSFKPRIPGRIEKLRFCITVRGQLLEVDIDRATATYTLLEGEELAIQHEEEELRLCRESPTCTRPHL